MVIMGFANLYSSDYYPGQQIPFFATTYGKELIWIIISLVIGGILLLIDAYVYLSLAYIIYLIVIGLLVLVIAIGIATHGAQSWLGIGSIRIQPSEFAKYATALVLAKYLSEKKVEFNWRNIRHLFVIATILGLPVVLILLQPDVGSAMVFLAFLLVLYREGLSGWWLIWILAVVLVFVLSLKIPMLTLIIALTLIYLVVLFLVIRRKNIFYRIFIFSISFFVFFYFVDIFFKWQMQLLYIVLITALSTMIFSFLNFIRKREKHAVIATLFMLSLIFVQFSTDYAFKHILKPHHRNRIEVLFDNSIDPRGIGYNLRQSKIAIGSGGFWGKGYLKGTQTKLNFVPAHDTDFVFCTLAEEWGLLGVGVYFFIYALFLILLVIKSEKQKSDFTRIYGYSVASLFFFHFFVNIGMTIGLLPVIGIPLPFFSYGGSSMLTFTILLFTFIKLDSEKNIKL